MNENDKQPQMRVPFTDLINLASERVGTLALSASDEFFAKKENLLKEDAPLFMADQYTEQGKWMDGWESRRKRNLSPENNHDWCVIQLGLPGVIRGVDVDTSFFTGNYPEYCSIEAMAVAMGVSMSESKSEIVGKTTEKSISTDFKWKEILPKVRLQGGMSNLFPISSTEKWSHLRLKIFPDGGVARLRVYGEVLPDWEKMMNSNELFDFAAAAHGAQVITCNDMFFGKKDNLILPGRARNMGEGWETRRRRGPGHDWLIVQLAHSAKLVKLEVDTNHFKGNYPESCSVEGCVYPKRDLLPSDFRDRTDLQWTEILPRTKLQPNVQHFFENELKQKEMERSFDYLRLNIFPDGGISRFRAYGKVE